MFSRHYQSELAFLRDTGREFGARHPGLAESLRHPGSDPDVERLLEGFAFLAARIRERTDAAVPEMLEPLAEMVAPHVLRGVPAATILELEGRPGALRARHTIAAGAMFGSRPIEGTPCPFQTREAVELTTARAGECRLDEQREGTPEIVFSLRVPESGRAALVSDSPLRMFLHGNHALASMLLFWFARHIEQVVIRVAPGDEIALAKDAIRLPAIEAEMGDLWPWPETAPAGVRAIAEYFVLPERFFFVDVRGLERVPVDRLRTERGESALDLVFRFRSPPSLPERLPADALRLHCVPAINLFETTGEPVRRDPLREEELLRAAGLAPSHADVFEVRKVAGRRPRRGGDVTYAPLSAFVDRAQGPTFALRRRASALDGGVDTYLCLSEADPELSDETISIEMACTSRGLPSALRAGDVGAPLASSPTLATARNVGRVSRPVPAPIGRELQWRLLGQLATTHRSIATRDALAGLLGSLNLPDSVDVHTARSNQLRIQAIREVRVGPATRALRGAIVRGIETRIALDEARLAGAGDAFLFGCVLDRLFSAEIPVNAFSVLSLDLHPSRAELAWTARTGTRFPL